jgi:hypothetical protein
MPAQAAHGVGTHTALHDAAHEGGGRPVKDRNLWAINLDQGVVNATTGNRGHQVFDGRNLQTRCVLKLGTQRGAVHRVPTGGDQTIADVQIAARKPDAVMCSSRTDRNSRRKARMQALTDKTDLCLDCCLHDETSVVKERLSKLNNLLSAWFLMLNSIIATV